MIVPMKKLSLLLYHREKSVFLDELRDLGVIHIEENPVEISPELQQCLERIKAADTVLKALNKIAKSKKETAAQEKSGDTEAVIQQYNDYESALDQIDQKTGALKKDISLLTPWGDFEWESIERLKNAGVTVRFFELSEKKFKQLNKDDLRYAVISILSGTVYFIVLEYENAVTIDAEEVMVPKQSRSSAQQQMQQLFKEKENIQKSMQEMVKYQDLLSAYIQEHTSKRNYEMAQLSMVDMVDGKVLSLTGWLPVHSEKKVSAFLTQFPAWFAITAPTKQDTVPILLNNNRFSKLFEPITRLFQLPDYFELDPTPFIAPFFAVFFGFCLGDAGYGVVIFLIATILQFKVSGGLRLILALGQILSAATVVMSIVTAGTFFGVAVLDLALQPAFSVLKGAILVHDDVVITPFNFALILGIMQMTLGMILDIYKRARFYSFIHALPVIGKLFIVESGILLFLISYQKIDVLRPLFPLSIAALIAGIIAIIYVSFFTDIDKYLDIKAVNLVLRFYFIISGAVGDILSYIRLFALGLASGILGYVVNVIALQIRGIPIAGWLLFVLFLVIGHTVNLLLASLSSFVHPLRLTFVEFYNNLEFTGGGKEYKPFKSFIERSRV